MALAPSEGQVEGQPRADRVCNRVKCDTDSVVIAKRCDETDCWVFGNFPEVNYCKDVITQYSVLGGTIARVEGVKVTVCGVNGKKAVALCDSGSQISIVSSRLLDVSNDDKMGTVNLQGVVGDCTVDECE